MPEIRTDVPFISPVPANQVGLDTIMMMVNMDRANMLDGQVRAQAKAIQDKNTILTKSNLIYGEMKSAQSGGSNTMSPAMEQFLKDNGITVSGKTIVTLDGDTGITTTRVDMSKDQWDQQMGHMKTFIDNLTSSSQLDMTQLQSVMNKFNQTTEGLSNWISKDSQSKGTIVGNQR